MCNGSDVKKDGTPIDSRKLMSTLLQQQTPRDRGCYCTRARFLTLLALLLLPVHWLADHFWFSKYVRGNGVASAATLTCPRTREAMLDAVATALERAHVPYYLTYGTLLGAVRRNRIIPWTADIDIQVPDLGQAREVFRRIAGSEMTGAPGPARNDGGANAADACFTAEPFVDNDLFHLYSKASDVEIVKHGYFRRSTAYVDVYGIFPRDDGANAEKMHYLVGSRSPLNRNGITVPHSFLFPLNASGVSIGGRAYAAPRDPAALLRLIYDDDWQEEDDRHAGGG